MKSPYPTTAYQAFVENFRKFWNQVLSKVYIPKRNSCRMKKNKTNEGLKVYTSKRQKSKILTGKCKIGSHTYMTWQTV